MKKNQQNEPCLSKAGVEKALKEFMGDGYNDKIEQIINENFIGWYSRSVAGVLFLFAKNKKGKWCVLGIKRGQGCPDFQGYWCSVCGYLDFNETVEECAVRETYEESGIVVSPKDIVYVGHETDPVRANRQNITFRYMKVFENNIKPWQLVWPISLITKKLYKNVIWAEDVKTNRNHCEEDEVDDIRWIPLTEIDDYKWAFGHCGLIKEIAKKHGLI